MFLANKLHYCNNGHKISILLFILLLCHILPNSFGGSVEVITTIFPLNSDNHYNKNNSDKNNNKKSIIIRSKKIRNNPLKIKTSLPSIPSPISSSLSLLDQKKVLTIPSIKKSKTNTKTSYKNDKIIDLKNTKNNQKQTKNRKKNSRKYLSDNNSNHLLRTRRNQSKDLKKLIQDLEESDYSNYGE